MTQAYPIPDVALDDRLAWLGTAGAGKTYNAGGGLERLLQRGARVIIVDPLDVWWGLRLDAAGKSPSPFSVVIFGGVHGDLPLNEAAGALIGETVAGMAESCIVSLGEFKSKAAERRFMLAFLETLYRKASGEPVHLVFDEADLWAPQKPVEPQLQALMEAIVRRGRIKGFIPWLITQRPAVLSKDVLSQADGLIAFKLTSSQDRDAIGAWIEGQADRAQGKEILASLPAMGRGQGVVWLPGRGILATEQFPAKQSFDSSRTPKRGEKRRSAALAPIDLGALRYRLASVQEEAKANDPKALKAEIARLKQQMATAGKQPAVRELAAIEEAERRGHVRALREFEDRLRGERSHAFRAGASSQLRRLVDALARAAMLNGDAKVLSQMAARLQKIELHAPAAQNAPPPAAEAPASASSVPGEFRPRPAVGAAGPGIAPVLSSEATILPPTRWSILVGLRQLEALGQASPEKSNVAWFAGASPSSSSFANNLGALRSAGLVDYPTPGTVSLAGESRALVGPVAAPTHDDIMALVRQKLTPAQLRMLEAAILHYPKDLALQDLANAIGASLTSSSFSNNRGRLKSLGLIEYPPGTRQVRAADVLFP